MKAVIHRAYGSPEKVLSLQEVEKPAHKDGEVLKKPEALAIFRDLLESGKLAPVVARTFPLSEVPLAMRCMQEGKALGRVIITP